MDRKEINAFCNALPHAIHVGQWGGCDVWKIGGKVFAIVGWDDGTCAGVSFKCSETSFEILKEQPGQRPAPYLAARGMTWIQRMNAETMTQAALEDYVRESYRLVALGLTKRQRRELSLEH